MRGALCASGRAEGELVRRSTGAAERSMIMVYVPEGELVRRSTGAAERSMMEGNDGGGRVQTAKAGWRRLVRTDGQGRAPNQQDTTERRNA